MPPAEQYARDVIAGRIVACRLVKLACERHVRDLADGWNRGLKFDAAAAQDVLDFFGFLKHSKGEWAGQSFTLAPWQQFVVWCIFGWRRSDGTRRFRSVLVEVARKNGKSTLAAGIGLYLAFADGEPGAEVYAFATKRDQATIVWEEAARMRDASPALSKRVLKFRNNLNWPKMASKFEPLGGDKDTMDGLNPNGAIADELHAHKTRGMWDVIETAMGARRQPMMFAVTTAGLPRESIYQDQHSYAEKILEGIQEDDNFFAYIAALEAADDWEDESTWIKANPNLNISVKIDNLRELARKAKAQPAALNAFLRLRLNRPASEFARWIPPDKWNACVGWPWKDERGVVRDAKSLLAEVLPQLDGRPCIFAIDLASKTDIAAYVKLFPPLEEDQPFIFIPRFYVPSENVLERVKTDRVPYDVWIREGFITATEGNVIDYDFIKQHVFEDAKRYQLSEVAFDPWNATQFANDLQKEGLVPVEIRQGFKSLTEPTKNFLALVLSKKIAHLGNPVLKWMASNVVIKMDEAGNEKPNKAKSAERIDGIVACIMALSRAMFAPPAPGPSRIEWLEL